MRIVFMGLRGLQLLIELGALLNRLGELLGQTRVFQSVDFEVKFQGFYLIFKLGLLSGELNHLFIGDLFFEFGRIQLLSKIEGVCGRLSLDWGFLCVLVVSESVGRQCQFSSAPV